jgi:phosphatidylglycerol:prolipoprotein diacylglycerol transferase
MKRFLIAVAGLGLAAALVYFFFAPTFDGQYEIQPSLQVGAFKVRYYGLIMGAAILSGYFVARSNSWRFGISPDEVDKYTFWSVLVGFFSARLYFILFDVGYFIEYPGEIVKVWNGGLSLYGAIIGGLIFTYLYSRGKAYSIWQLLDLAALALPLGQAIGRFGNFFNYEAYGSHTSLPWKMFVPEEGDYFHPTFLYEAIANILIFALLYSVKGKMKPGNLALLYLALYALVRFMIEPLRLDSVYLSSFRVDQVVSGIVFVLAGIALLYRRQTAPKTV